MANTKNLGIVSPVPMGDWNASTTYNFLNVVNHNKSTYLARLQNVKIEPGVNGNWATYWMLLSPSYEEIVSAFTDDLNTAIENYEQILGVKFDDLETQLTEQWTEKSNALTEQFNDLEQSVTEQVTKNTNEIKALFGLNVTKGVLAYDNATSTAEVQQTGGADLVGLNILDGSYATVNKIQGKTVKRANLFDSSKVTGLESGTGDKSSYLIKNTDGSLTITIGRISSGVCWFTGTKMFLPVGSYTISATIINNDAFGDDTVFGFAAMDGQRIDSNTETIPAKTTKRISYTYSIVTAGEYYLVLSPKGTNENSKNLNISYADIQVEYGSTALPYTPYFDGLKNAQISGIKSVSNLLQTYGRTQAENFKQGDSFNANEYIVGIAWNGLMSELQPTAYSIEDNKISVTTTNIAGYGVGFPVKCKPNTQYTWNGTVSGNGGVYVAGFKADFTKVSGTSIFGGINGTAGKSFTTPSDCEWLLFVFTSNSSGEAGTYEFSNLRLNYGSTASPYRKYEESIMQLPETVELGEWDSIDGKTLTKGTSEILTLTGNEVQPYDSVNSSGWSYAEVNSRNTNMVNIFYLPPTTITLLTEQTPIVSNPYKGIGAYDWLYGESDNAVYVNNFAFISGTRGQIGVQLSKTTIGFDANNIPEYENLPAGITAETKYLTDLMLAYIKANPLTLVSKLAEPTVTELDFNNEYLVWDKGQETVLTPTDESGNTCFDYGANTTTETDYWVIVGGNE